MPERQDDDVLTLAEAASYLRVSEEELLRLSEQREIPAQRDAIIQRQIRLDVGVRQAVARRLDARRVERPGLQFSSGAAGLSRLASGKLCDL